MADISVVVGGQVKTTVAGGPTPSVNVEVDEEAPPTDAEVLPTTDPIVMGIVGNALVDEEELSPDIVVLPRIEPGVIGILGSAFVDGDALPLLLLELESPE